MTKIILMSSGLGLVNRGFENECLKLFNKLNSIFKNDLLLFKGGGNSINSHVKVPNFPMHGSLAVLLGRLTGRHPYEIQNYSFFCGSLYMIIKYHPEIIYLGEPILYKLLSKFRDIFKLSYKLIYFTGGGFVPNEIKETDTIQFVVPPDVIGISTEKIKSNYVLLPHFIDFEFEIQQDEVADLRKKLNISDKARVILTVGAIDSQKRMDYVIREVAELDIDTFLIVLGQEEVDTPKIREVAGMLLPGRHCITTVPHEKISLYYKLADIFILASLKEGFGLVYLEALSFGLPVIAHDFPVSRYILKEWGLYTDLSKPGALGELLRTHIETEESPVIKELRIKFVHDNYSWESLREGYLELFGLIEAGS